MSNPYAKRHIVHEVGLCLMSLGRLAEAATFYERSNAIALSMEDWTNAGRGYLNLASSHAQRQSLGFGRVGSESTLRDQSKR